MTHEGWDLVISQCNNALHIENSTNPGLHKFLDEDEMQNSNKETRIEDVKKQIRRYLYVSQHRIKVDTVEMEVRTKRMKVPVGDWIVKNREQVIILLQ